MRHPRRHQLRSFDKGASRSSGHLLFRTVLEKAFFSSPAACRKSVEQRLAKLASKSDIAADNDRATLQKLAAAVDAVTPDQFTKYQTLLKLLRPGGKLNWNPNRANDRLVIFTERVETLKFLHERLLADLKLRPNQVPETNARFQTEMRRRAIRSSEEQRA